MTKQTQKLAAFGLLAIAITLTSIAYFLRPSASDLKVEVAALNVTAPKCDKHNRSAGINWDEVQSNVDGIRRSMGQPKNLDVKQLDYEALHKAGLLQH